MSRQYLKKRLCQLIRITWHKIFIQLLFVSSPHSVVVAFSPLVCLYSFGSIAFSFVRLTLYFSPCIAVSSLLLFLCSFLCIALLFHLFFLCFSHYIASSLLCFLCSFVYFFLLLCMCSFCNMLCYGLLFYLYDFGCITFDMFQSVPCCLLCILSDFYR